LGGVTETHETFECFGGTCSVHVIGDGSFEAARSAKDQLLDWHDRFTRFEPDSEVSPAQPGPAIRRAGQS
jgi:hypothetical protein